jgi:hypothetical protein
MASIGGSEGLRQRREAEKSHIPYEPLDKIDEKVSSYPVKGRRVLLPIPEGSVLICLGLTLIALWTRLYKINWNDHVVWDEAHFG